MSLRDENDRRLSSTNELSLDISPPTPPPSSSSSPTTSKPNDTPYSPRPRLFDNLPLPEGPQASDVLSDADYRQLRSSAFSLRSILPPLLLSAGVGYISPRVFRTKASNVGIVRTGMFTVALALSLSYTTYSHLSSAIQKARVKAQHAALPRTDDGQILLPDQSSQKDRYELSTDPPSAGRANMTDLDKDIAKMRTQRDRTRWLKGKGLAGEVEEEGEMRDTFFRPGTPRNG